MRKVRKFIKWYFEQYSKLCMASGGYYIPNH